MSIVRADFDGTAFVPRDRVELPVGTPVRVIVPDPFPPAVADADAEWDEILVEIRNSKPAFPTVEDALDRSRRRG